MTEQINSIRELKRNKPNTHYNSEFRKKVIASVKSGNSQTVVAQIFNLSRSTIYIWLKRFDENKELKARKKISKSNLDCELLKKIILEEPDLTLDEIAKKVGFCRSYVHRVMTKLGFKYKKKLKVMQNQTSKSAQNFLTEWKILKKETIK